MVARAPSAPPQGYLSHEAHPVVMHRDRGQTSGHPQPVLARRAVEDHGRVLTTNIQAAALYRQAQQAVSAPLAVAALRLAAKADPVFQLAAADLDAIADTEAPWRHSSVRRMNWERHHIEVVCAAAAGNFSRATDLLREHLASVGCDPLALRIVIELQRRSGNQGGLEDIIGDLPDCHSGSSWWS
jgi:hypothetical protein